MTSNPIKNISNAVDELRSAIKENKGKVRLTQDKVSETIKIFFDSLKRTAVAENIVVDTNEIDALVGKVDLIVSVNIKRQLQTYLTLLFHFLAQKKATGNLKTDEKVLDIESYQERFGKVPVIGKVFLSEEKFLPKKYKESKANASKIIIPNPNRDEVSFFQSPIENQTKTTSVAQSILEKHTKLLKNDDFVSAASLEFHNIKNLQADHVHPYSSILARVRLFLLAINIDQKRHENIICKSVEEGYIALEKGDYFGTKALYLELFNDIENIWFLSQAENAGAGKLEADPRDWIENDWIFGEKFLKYLSENELYIDDSEIILRVRSNKKKDFVRGIGSLALEWLDTNYQSLINFRADLLENYRSISSLIVPHPHSEEEKILRYLAGQFMLKLLNINKIDYTDIKKLITAKNWDHLIKEGSETSSQHQRRLISGVEQTLAQPISLASLAANVKKRKVDQNDNDQ